MDKLNAKELKQMKKHHRKLIDKLIDTVDNVNQDVLSVTFVLPVIRSTLPFTLASHT